MRKIILTIVGLFLLWASHPAFAGGRFFVGIGIPSLFTPGVIGFFHHRRARADFFFQLGPHSFSTFHLASGPWGYQYPSPIALPYPIAPQEIPQRSFSGTDPQGVLYVDGYRVLPSGWLRIRVEPTDAEVLVDGFPVVIDSISGTSASVGFLVGKHQVEVRKPGFQEFRSEVEITQARESRLKIKLGE